MPSTSEAMRRLMGMALAAKRGNIPPSRINPQNRGVLKMSQPQLRDFAKGPVVRKPTAPKMRKRGFKSFEEMSEMKKGMM